MRKLALVLCLWPALALGQGAQQRPMPKPAFAEAPVARPKPRPAALALPETALSAPKAALGRIASGLRPQPRPEGLILPVSAPKAQSPSLSMQGAICDRPEIKGRRLAPMRSTTPGCGMAEPVEVTEIAGVKLSPAATIICEEARALSNFVQEGLQPAFGNQIVKIQLADSYSCRPRNNVRGNKVSVHGKGEAVDLQAVVLRAGEVVAVKSRLDRRWQRARKAGCGTFTVILGPGSDGFHENHIHFDVSDHGGGPYCR